MTDSLNSGFAWFQPPPPLLSEINYYLNVLTANWLTECQRASKVLLGWQPEVREGGSPGGQEAFVMAEGTCCWPLAEGAGGHRSPCEGQLTQGSSELGPGMLRQPPAALRLLVHILSGKWSLKMGVGDVEGRQAASQPEVLSDTTGTVLPGVNLGLDAGSPGPVQACGSQGLDAPGT